MIIHGEFNIKMVFENILRNGTRFYWSEIKHQFECVAPGYMKRYMNWKLLHSIGCKKWYELE